MTVNLRVKNITEVSALHVRICDTLPGGLAVASAPGFSVHGNTVCKAIGTLGPVAAKTVSFTARVTASGSSTLTDHAVATASNARAARARARVTVTPAPKVTG